MGRSIGRNDGEDGVGALDIENAVVAGDTKVGTELALPMLSKFRFLNGLCESFSFQSEWCKTYHTHTGSFRSVQNELMLQTSSGLLVVREVGSGLQFL
jgi:hypothetical protein